MVTAGALLLGKCLMLSWKEVWSLSFCWVPVLAHPARAIGPLGAASALLSCFSKGKYLLGFLMLS